MEHVKKYWGITEYYKNGVLHRDGDLPAVISARGDLEYWMYGGGEEEEPQEDSLSVEMIVRGIPKTMKTRAEALLAHLKEREMLLRGTIWVKSYWTVSLYRNPTFPILCRMR